MGKNLIILLAIILFIAGPAAKVNALPHSEYYLILSGIGLVTLTAFLFKKKSS
jgi:glucose dehydrogenase